ncbi:MAG TPA: trigger factor, partial [Terriglobales bacterium]|nr:trigger factor [Terriglobales bacterium]
ELGDYRSIRTEMNVPPTGPADVEAALEALRQRHSSTEPSDAAQAEDGAIAVVEATPLPANESDVAPEAAPASVPPPALPQELSIEVGGADTLPQFSEALRGMRPDEERDLEVAYPADYPNAGLAGQTRKYHLKLKGIQKKTVPDLTDDFVKHATGADTVEELRRRIGENLTAERQHQARHQAEEAIVDQLLRQSPFPVPESLVDKQVEAKIERNLRGLADQGLDPRKLKLDWAKLRKRHEDSARREVRAALLLEKIADKENIAATPEAVEAEVQRAAEELQQPVDALRARLRDNGVLDRIENRIRQESVLEFLVRNATGTVAGSVEGAATQ